jgi:hypothetical protein
MVLAAFLAMNAPARAAWWSAIVLGLLLDVTNQFTLRGRSEPGVVIGPHALAMLPAVWSVITLRGVMMRRNPLALGVLTFAGALAAQGTLLIIFSIRSAYEPLAWSVWGEVLARAGSALYTGLVGAPLALVLLPLAPFLGLPSPQHRRFARV